jgi:hypothetical protein
MYSFFVAHPGRRGRPAGGIRCCSTMLAPIVAAAAMVGCRSPFYADRGAGVGALGGTGVGALVGNAVGNTAGGALIGAGVGAIGGAAVGSAIDEVQAQNRAEIAAQLGRQVPAGAATMEEVVAMTRAGVDPRLVQNYVRTSGMVRPVTAQDVIYLHQNSVPADTIAVMQNPPTPATAPVPMVAAAPAPVIVEEHYYGPSYCGPSWRHHHYHRGPSVSWGISVGN